MKKILTVVGARPQFIKAAVISRLIRSEVWKGRLLERIVHTGQHYDPNMSDVFFSEMNIPFPDLNLGVGGTGHGAMTGEMLVLLEKEILSSKPDLLLVYGDTNSTLAGALAASKLHVPVAHVEAGLRSRDKSMPEEQNRILVDHLATWLFCPTTSAVVNLAREGILETAAARATCDAPRVALVGDVMLDASLFYRGRAVERPESERFLFRMRQYPGLDLQEGFDLLTLHRAENTDDPRRLARIFQALSSAGGRPLIFPLHPRTKKALEMAEITLGPRIVAIDPVGYLDMLELEAASQRIITDSGGVQKEAYFFGKPCITLRSSTEWVETLEGGWNRLTGADPEAIVHALAAEAPKGSRPDHYGQGEAGRKILECLFGKL